MRVFRGWGEYYEKEPFFADRMECLLAQISYLIASFMGSSAKIDDFFISKRENKRNLKDEIKKCFGI